MARQFVKMIRAHAREVLELQDEQADRFLELLRSTWNELSGRLQRLNLASSAELDAFKVRQILAVTEAQINTLESTASGVAKKAAVDAAELSVQHITNELESLSSAFDTDPISLDFNVEKVLADPGHDLLAEKFESSLARYGQDALNGVRQRMFLGLRAGDDTSDVISDLMAKDGPLGDVSEGAASRLVRTETANLYGAAQHKSLIESSKQIPGLKKVWIHVGSYPCPTCMRLHGTSRPMNGYWTIKSGRKILKVQHNPAHPNCLLAGSLIETEFGARPIEEFRPGDYVIGGLTGKSRRVTDFHINNFSGSLVDISGDDFKISLTPNHPVLTHRGWIAANDLEIGDAVFRHVFQRDIFGSDSSARDSYNLPSMLMKEVLLEDIGLSLFVRTMPVPSVNFNCNLLFYNSQINSPVAYNELMNDIDVSRIKCGHKRSFAFSGSDQSTGFCNGSLALRLNRSFRSSDGHICRTSSSFSFFWRNTASLKKSRFRKTSPRNSVFFHDSIDNGTRAFKMASNGSDSHFLIPMHRTQNIGVNFYPFHIKNIKRIQHVGKVFNLSVDGDESYVANDIVVHNCVCRVSGMKPSWRSKLDALGYLDAVED